MNPHSNMRAEIGVKSMKRLCRENVSAGGGLDNDRFLRAVLQYRNTPDRDTGRSPAEVLYGRRLRDHIPGRTEQFVPREEWRLLQEDRERALAKRAVRSEERWSRDSRTLPALQVGDQVRLQNQVGERSTRWDKTGEVIEVKDYDQYLVLVHGSGRLTLRNRQFLRKIVPYWARDVPSSDRGEVDRPRRVRSEPERLVVSGRGKCYSSNPPSTNEVSVGLVNLEGGA